MEGTRSKRSSGRSLLLLNRSISRSLLTVEGSRSKRSSGRSLLLLNRSFSRSLLTFMRTLGMPWIVGLFCLGIKSLLAIN